MVSSLFVVNGKSELWESEKPMILTGTLLVWMRPREVTKFE